MEKYALYRINETPYQQAWDFQKERVQLLDVQKASESLILLEHPHTITLGSVGNQENLLLHKEGLQQRGIDFVKIDRGGDITYHGPGQLVGYPILYLGDGLDAHQYLRSLEEIIIRALGDFDIVAGRKSPYTGAWVNHEKIAAIGVKFNKCRHRKGYITSHGFALNVNTDLSMFQTIVPCGITEYGVTSMHKLLGGPVDMDRVVDRIIHHFNEVFNRQPDLQML
jgi:lipoyl(octanoyl) transferase